MVTSSATLTDLESKGADAVSISGHLQDGFFVFRERRMAPSLTVILYCKFRVLYFHSLGPSIVEDAGVPTWSVTDESFKTHLVLLYLSINIDSDQSQTTKNIQQLPIISEGFGLPYFLLDGTPQLFFSSQVFLIFGLYNQRQMTMQVYLAGCARKWFHLGICGTMLDSTYFWH